MEEGKTNPNIVLMPIIETIQPPEADGYLGEIYDQILESRGKIAEVFKAQSLHPRSIIRHLDLYMTLMYGKSPLSREQREMLGIVVSAVNKCDYCIKHHAKALIHFWDDEQRVTLLTRDFKKASLDNLDTLLCQLAEIVTTSPNSKKIQSLIKKLKKEEVSDRAVLDATMIIAYFNFVNRIVLALEVESEKDTEDYIY